MKTMITDVQMKLNGADEVAGPPGSIHESTLI